MLHLKLLVNCVAIDIVVYSSNTFPQDQTLTVMGLDLLITYFCHCMHDSMKSHACLAWCI